MKENHPRVLLERSESISSVSINTTPTSILRLKKRRMSDEEHSAGDFFLTNKELNLDQLTWEDIKHTRVGRRLTFDIDKRDRDIIDLKAKCISLEERYRS